TGKARLRMILPFPRGTADKKWLFLFIRWQSGFTCVCAKRLDGAARTDAHAGGRFGDPVAGPRRTRRGPVQRRRTSDHAPALRYAPRYASRTRGSSMRSLASPLTEMTPVSST